MSLTKLESLALWRIGNLAAEGSDGLPKMEPGNIMQEGSPAQIAWRNLNEIKEWVAAIREAQ